MHERPIEEGLEAVEPGVGDYYIGIGLVALLLMAVAQDQYLPGSAGVLTFAPYVIGALALIFRFPWGPPLVLVMMAGMFAMQSAHEEGLIVRRRASVNVRAQMYLLLMAGSGLAFTATYYRRLGLGAAIFPRDRRSAPPPEPGKKAAPVPSIRRAQHLATPYELYMLFTTLVICAGVGYLLWVILQRLPPLRFLAFRSDIGLWQLLLVGLAFVGVIAVIGVAIEYLQRARATPLQNLLYLQDQVWRETQAEQGRIVAWLTRARLRLERRKGKS